MKAVGRLRHERDARKIGEGIAVPKGNSPPLLNTKIKNFESAPANAGQHITHPVVVADLRVLIRDAWIARLRRPKTRLCDPMLHLSIRACRRRMS